MGCDDIRATSSGKQRNVDSFVCRRSFPSHSYRPGLPRFRCPLFLIKWECQPGRVAATETDTVHRQKTRDGICHCFFSPFTAKSLGQGAVGPGVLPHEPHRGGLLWPGVPEPSKDNGELMEEKMASESDQK